MCQQQKHSTLHPAGLLKPLDLPNRVWEEISMDFIEALPKSNGMDTILVVVDRLSKFAHFLPLKHSFTAAKVATAFVKDIVRLHGFPESIVSDRDKIFMILFWKELFRLQGTVLKKSTAYHPQTDGQSEVVNKTLETYLRCFVQGRPHKWIKWVPWVELWYNTSYHASSKYTPFKILYGRDPPRISRYSAGQTAVSTLDEQLAARNVVLDDLKFNLLLAQQKMKKQEDKKRTDVQIEEGTFVFLKLQPYRQQSLARRPYEKLAPRFYGSFEVLKTIGKVAYHLKLPYSSRIHPVFHVSQLKIAKGNHTAPAALPPQLASNLDLEVEPEDVLGVRSRDHPKRTIREVLIKWKGLPTTEATWEDLDLIDGTFPSFHLEDKVAVWGWGIAKPPVIFIYSRRGKKGNKEGRKATVEEQG